MKCQAKLGYIVRSMRSLFSKLPFRISRATSDRSWPWNLAKTLTQTAVFWGVFLYLVPVTILDFESRIGLVRYDHPVLDVFAVVGFVIASLGGLSSGVTMAIAGRGTPLPVDTASRLVVVGPYRYIRNPMAFFGLAQGFFVGLYLGSYFVFPYVFLGGWIWNRYVRPIEEAELAVRFGVAYETYRNRVPCWWFRKF